LLDVRWRVAGNGQVKPWSLRRWHCGRPGADSRKPIIRFQRLPLSDRGHGEESPVACFWMIVPLSKEAPARTHPRRGKLAFPCAAWEGRIAERPRQNICAVEASNNTMGHSTNGQEAAHCPGQIGYRRPRCFMDVLPRPGLGVAAAPVAAPGPHRARLLRRLERSRRRFLLRREARRAAHSGASRRSSGIKWTREARPGNNTPARGQDWRRPSPLNVPKSRQWNRQACGPLKNGRGNGRIRSLPIQSKARRAKPAQ
jgi:hypothetical protein